VPTGVGVQVPPRAPNKENPEAVEASGFSFIPSHFRPFLREIFFRKTKNIFRKRRCFSLILLTEMLTPFCSDRHHFQGSTKLKTSGLFLENH